MLSSLMFWRSNAVRYYPESQTLAVRSHVKYVYGGTFIQVGLDGDVWFDLNTNEQGRTDLMLVRGDDEEQLLLTFHQRQDAERMKRTIEQTLAPTNHVRSVLKKWIQGMMWVLGLFVLLIIAGSLFQGASRYWQMSHMAATSLTLPSSGSINSGQTQTLTPEQKALLAEKIRQYEANARMNGNNADVSAPSAPVQTAPSVPQNQAPAPSTVSPGDVVAQGLEGQ